MKNEAIPRLRFKGFRSKWQKNNLGELMKVTSSRRIHRSDWRSHGIPFLRIRDIIARRNNQVDKDLVFISKRAYKKRIEVSGAPTIGDLLVVGTGQAGTPYLVNTHKPFYFKDADIVWFKNNILDKYFLFYCFNSIPIQKFIKIYSAAGTVAHYTINLGRRTPIKYPNLPEQQLIGKFFAKLDKLIQLQQKKVALLKKLKRGYLQKLFPRKSKSVPRLRFEGFHDKWRLNKLNKYLSIPKKRKAHVTKLNQIMTLKLHLKGLFRGSNRETLSLGSTNYYIRHAGQLLYGKQNFFHGSMSLIPKRFDGLATSSDIPSLNISGIDSHYLFIYISRYNFWKYSERYATGTGSMRLHEKDLMSMYIHVPSIREQEVIVKFVTELNDYLKYNQKQLAHLCKLKKAYLQKMFC